MILYHRGLKQPYYEARHWAGGWAVYEDDRVMAACNNEAEARTIAQALNLQRVMLALNITVGRPPARPELN